MSAPEILLPSNGWRHALGLKPTRPKTHIKIGCLNAVPTIGGGLHRWLHRGDLLKLLYSEADRLNSSDLRLLADRINETTRKEETT